jgi:hypothetical protein
MHSQTKAVWFISILVILSLTLTACGSAPETPDGAAPAAPAASQVSTPAGAAEATPATGSDDQASPTQAAALPTDASAVAPTSAGGETDVTIQKDKLVSDLGFRPDANGFNFENYGSESDAQNLTAVEIQRMFGDQVCAFMKDGACVLTPTAEQWMEETNTAMAGGHCEGLAALSLILYDKQENPTDFGGSAAHDLSLSNAKLQHEIAYWWATQSVAPTTSGLIEGTPKDILKTLQDMTPTSETYTIGIYKRDGSGGHAITPFAVEDDGDGVYAVLVYDNNYPNQVRKLIIDANKNTWSYEASINPSVESEIYEGDADTQTLDLTPTSIRLTQQDCPFCSSGTARTAPGLAAPAKQYNQIYLEGEGHLLIEDDQGNQLGYVGGKLVNTIPGATYVNLKVDDVSKDSPEPIYLVPAGMDVRTTIDGSTLKTESTTDLVMVGPGFSIGVEGISLTPDQKDTVDFMPADEMIVYDTDSSESPNFALSIDNQHGNDYEFDLVGTDMQGGGTITIAVDTKQGQVFLNAEKLKNEGKFNVDMSRYSDTEEETFTASDVALKAGAVIYIDYADWKGNGTTAQFGVDNNGDGAIDDEYTVDDSQ